MVEAFVAEAFVRLTALCLGAFWGRQLPCAVGCLPACKEGATALYRLAASGPTRVIPRRWASSVTRTTLSHGTPGSGRMSTST